MEWDIMEVKCGLCNELVSESLTLLHTLKKLMSGNLDQKKRNSTSTVDGCIKTPYTFFNETSVYD